MAKITQEARELFTTMMTPHKDEIDKILEKEKTILLALHDGDVSNGYKRLMLAEDMIHASTIYLIINNLSLEILETKNTDALNEGRKILYKAIIYLEETVTNLIDAPYSEYEKDVQKIENTPLSKRYDLIRKIGLAIRLIMDAYGDNTKWKWSFVELEARFATVAKNLIDLKETIKIQFDPRHTDHDIAFYYLKLVKKLLLDASNGYRDKYELSTHRADDIRLSINYLIALRRIHILLEESEDAEEVKKRAVVIKSKMEFDQKKGICK